MLEKELSEAAVVMARRLLGSTLVRTLPDGLIRLKIVETEAYDQYDPASHSFRGPTPRTEVMFGPAGRVYVYFTYGMHYCMNIVTGKAGEGQAVLIRALEPIDEIEGPINGPARLCKTLGIDRELNGHNLEEPPLQLRLEPPVAYEQVVEAPRIGISKATEVLRRFYLAENPYVSRYNK